MQVRCTRASWDIAASVLTMSKILHRRLDSLNEVCAGGSGYRLHTQSGRSFIDATGSVGVCCVGYQDSRVIEAITSQAQRLAFVHNSLFTSQPAEDLAEYLLARASSRFGRVVFASGGSEAVETACKLARQYFFERGLPDRHVIISRRLSYHGATMGALSLSGLSSRLEPYRPALSQRFLADPCYPYRLQRDGETDQSYQERALQSIDDMINAVGPERVCAVLIEPVVGAAGGALPPVSGYLAGLRQLCDRYGILLIFDEVMCGLGRTGYRHAGDAEMVVADLQVVGKGLASGYQPLSAVYISRDIVQQFVDKGVDFRHGFTFMAHPIACAAALAVQKIVSEDGLVDNARRIGDYLRMAIRETTRGVAYIGDVRGRGLMIGMELVGDTATKKALPRDLQIHKRVKALCLEEGILVYPQASAADGEIGDTILLLPPLILDKSGAEEIAVRLGAAMKKLAHSIEGAVYR